MIMIRSVLNQSNTKTFLIKPKKTLPNLQYFHTTKRNEILPIIVGLATLTFITRYSYKALQHMEEEWHDYQEALEDYNARQKQELKRKGIIGIDIGSTNIRFSLYQNDNVSVVENQTGQRVTPIYYYQDIDNVIFGSMAKSKLYQENFVQNANDTKQYPLVLNPLIEFITSSKLNSSTEVPTTLTFHQEEVQELYKTIFPNYSFLHESIAIYHACLHYNLIKQTSQQKPVLIIDVGGTLTKFSILTDSKNVIYSSTSNLLSGYVLEYALVNYLIRQFYSFEYNELKDTLALQRIHDAAQEALLNLTQTKSRTFISIPFLSVDEQRNPRHLEMNVSSAILNMELNSVLEKNGSTSSNISTLFTILLMQVLEESNTTPMDLQNVICVGGGFKSSILHDGIKHGLGNLVGEGLAHEKLVIPPKEYLDELVVLGASIYSHDFD